MVVLVRRLRDMERLRSREESRQHEIWQLTTLFRLATLLAAGALLNSGAIPLRPTEVFWLAACAVVLAAMTAVQWFARRWPVALLATAEMFALAGLLGAAPSGLAPLSIAFLVAFLWLGLALRQVPAILFSTVASVTVVALAVASPGGWGSNLGSWVWTPLAVLACLVGGWMSNNHARHADADPDYGRALGLLQQLARLTRRLPVGLDRQAAIQALVSDVSTLRPDAQIDVYTRVGDGWIREYGAGVASDPVAAPGGSAWESMLENGRGSITRVGNAHVVALVPLQHHGAVLAVARIRTSTPFGRSDLQQIVEVSRSTPVRLEASNVFGQVRERAISEERARLSRQIHDGIAQDLAGLAYFLDATAQSVPPSEAQTSISQSADEVRRLVDELRFSIFDLRTELQTGERLGTTLSSYVRQVGERSGLRVHVEVDDVAGDVSADVAHELMRIAQEAITNVRRHAGATTLWVALDVRHDGIMLRVSDNGTGVAQRRTSRIGSGSGIPIMQERAERLRANLIVRERTGGGTVVECRMGPEAVVQLAPEPPARSTAAAVRTLVAAGTDGGPG